MAGRPKSIDDTKVFDVAKPGNAKPMGTSRPVIMSHAAPIKDPTVITVNGHEDMPAAKLSAPSESHRVLKPLSETETVNQTVVAKKSSITVLDEPKDDLDATVKTAPLITKSKSSMTADNESSVLEKQNVDTKDALPDTNEESPEQSADTVAINDETTLMTHADETTAEESAETAEDQTDKETATSPAEEVELEEKTAESADVEASPEPEAEKSEESFENTGSESASIDALAEASGKNKDEDKKAEEQAKKEAALQELIVSKKYFVPLAHDSSSQKSGSMVGIILLIFIILLAGAYAAVDAKVIKTGINLPYHLFKQ